MFKNRFSYLRMRIFDEKTETNHGNIYIYGGNKVIYKQIWNSIVIKL